MDLNKSLKSVPTKSQLEERVNILEVIGNAGMGGMENYITNFITNLPSSQFSITCICPNESAFTDLLRKLGVEEVYITPVTDDPAWRSIQLTTEVARLHKVDVLHSHMPRAHILAGLAGSLLQKPVVASVHGMNVTSQELGITRAVGSHLITNCQEAFGQALAMGVPAERVNLVRNSVDTAMFTPNNTGEKFRNAINVPANTKLVGFVGRLDQEKGPDLFLRAAEVIHQRCPDVHFVMVGDGVMRSTLEEMCIEMDLDKHVHFVGWWENTPEIYPAIDILGHTSRSDGTSLVLLEAMACGCPTVGLAVGGVREIIENERTGFIAGAGDWEGIALRIIKLLNNPENLKSMKVAARSRVQEHFNLKKNTAVIADLFRQIALPVVNGHLSATQTDMSPFIDNAQALDSIRGRRSRSKL